MAPKKPKAKVLAVGQKEKKITGNRENIRYTARHVRQRCVTGLRYPSRTFLLSGLYQLTFSPLFYGLYHPSIIGTYACPRGQAENELC